MNLLQWLKCYFEFHDFLRPVENSKLFKACITCGKILSKKNWKKGKSND